MALSPETPRAPSARLGHALHSAMSLAQTPTSAMVPPWVTEPLRDARGAHVAPARGASLSLCPGHAALPQSSTMGSPVSLRAAPEGHRGLGEVLLPWWAPAAPSAPGHCWHHAGWAQGTLAPGMAASGPTGLGTAQPCQGAGKELQSHLLKLGMQSRTWEERGAACPPFQLVSMVNTLCTANVTIFPG